MTPPTEGKHTGVDEKPLRMEAYYYAFGETGCRSVDLILSEVAWAGKRYHHTNGWTDDDNGPSCAEDIQTAANAAAKTFAIALSALNRIAEASPISGDGAKKIASDALTAITKATHP